MNTRSRMSLSSSPVFPDDIIAEILSWLTVKTLMKMKCVSKSWNTLISDSNFVKMHLNRSARHSQSYLVSEHRGDYNFVPFSVRGLMNGRSITLPKDPYYQLIEKDCPGVVGSCNGLVCLSGCVADVEEFEEMWLRIWNPATRTISDKLYFSANRLQCWEFMFGYDNTTQTYKVVALYPDSEMTTKVGIICFRNNIWRNIQSFPARLLQFSICSNRTLYAGVHLNSTLNWLGFIQDGDLAPQLVIISLDLGTETYTQFLPPPISLDLSHVLQKVSHAKPGVSMLMDSLCFYHDLNETDFVIWKMTKFGDEKSWAQLLKISYHKLKMNLKPGISMFNLYVNGDTLVFVDDQKERAILYNWRNNRVVKTRVNKKICWFSINHYVESLVSTS
ncbi:putative F-box domain-containing protein [Medicago truncatula]|uniref:F-box protein interaction domain protein n=2 Tax=Medicago truncatula TaxID=3880 RepID=G7ICP1_MEDTR|nr:F-box/kelch-repeat protein At3g23880 [Medicago truncatula]AES60799.1 F-box protein interaction domain protein [Medicago truncatula]RHN80127.1 putative F-box domain-containing protein [Medicago truncatula]